jgi:hypothetical protein
MEESIQNADETDDVIKGGGEGKMRDNRNEKQGKLKIFYAKEIVLKE